jgi:hypothetical protein
MLEAKRNLKPFFFKKKIKNQKLCPSKDRDLRYSLWSRNDPKQLLANVLTKHSIIYLYSNIKWVV